MIQTKREATMGKDTAEGRRTRFDTPIIELSTAGVIGKAAV